MIIAQGRLVPLRKQDVCELHVYTDGSAKPKEFEGIATWGFVVIANVVSPSQIRHGYDLI